MYFVTQMSWTFLCPPISFHRIVSNILSFHFLHLLQYLLEKHALVISILVIYNLREHLLPSSWPYMESLWKF